MATRPLREKSRPLAEAPRPVPVRKPRQIPRSSGLSIATLRYGFAVVTVLLCTVIRLRLNPVLGEMHPFTVYYLGVLLTAWYGGLAPTLLAVSLSLGLGCGLFINWHDTPPGSVSGHLLGSALYAVVGFSMAAFSEAFKVSQQRAEAMAQEARRQSDLLLREALARERIEEALQTANVRIEDILESVTDAFIVFDRRWRYLFLNERAAQMAGMPREELIGKCVWDMFPEAVGTPQYVEWQRTMREQTPAQFEACIPGTGQWFENRVFPSRDGIIVYTSDITDRKRTEAALRESEERFRLALANTEVFVFIQDRDLRYRWAYNPNPAFRSPMFIGKTDGEIFGAEDTEKIEREKREVIRAGVGKTGEVALTLGGELLYFDYIIQPLRDDEGQVTGLIGSAANVTERKQTEQSLRKHQEEIEDLNVRLRRAMAETHHRVKNNLQVIAALVDAQVMEDGPTVPVDELVRISRHVRALAAIHDLLTQEAKQNAEVSDISVRAALDKLMPMMQATLDSRRAVRYDVEDVRIPVRQGASLTMLVNELVSNAVKHGQGDIDVRFAVTVSGDGRMVKNGSGHLANGSSSAAPDEMARLEVCDDGPGFPEGFDPIASAHTGLQLIESASRWDLQGQTSYETRAEGGGRVVVTFPLPKA